MRKIKIVAMCALTFLAAAASLLDIYLQNRNTVNSGFVFINGKYIEAPYRLEMSGDKITINGLTVYVGMGEGAVNVLASNDLSVPAWVSEKTTPSELLETEWGEVAGLPFQKWKYLAQNHTPQVAAEKMIRFMRSLPCISSVEPRPPVGDGYYLFLMLHFKNGREFGLRLIEPGFVSSDNLGIPAWVNEKTTLGELLQGETGGMSDGMLAEKWTYLEQNNSPKDAADKMLKFIRSLPCMSSVHLAGSPEEDVYYVSFKLTPKEGIGGYVTFGSPDRRRTSSHGRPTYLYNGDRCGVQTIRRNRGVQDHFLLLKGLLKKNSFAFFYNGHIASTRSEEKALQKLPALIEMLGSDLDRDEKISLATKLDLTIHNDLLVDNFVPSKQLDDRLAAMMKKLGVKPMTLEKLRAMPDPFQSETKPARPH